MTKRMSREMTTIGTTKAKRIMVMSCFGVLMKPSCSAVFSTFCSGVFIIEYEFLSEGQWPVLHDVRAAHGCLRMITAHVGDARSRDYTFFAKHATITGLAPVVQWIELEFPKLSIQVRFLSGAPEFTIALKFHGALNAA